MVSIVTFEYFSASINLSPMLSNLTMNDLKMHYSLLLQMSMLSILLSKVI